MKTVLPALAILSMAVFAPGCVITVDSQGHIVREEKRFTVSGPPDVHLSTFDGAIEIRAADTHDVTVEIEKRGPSPEAVERLEVSSRQTGNRIDVEVKKPFGDHLWFGLGGHMSPTAKLIVTLPTESDVTARSGDGSVRIDRVHGHLDVRTGDGGIRASDVGGHMKFNTGDGSVTLDGVDGDLDLETGDGGVSVSGKLGAVRLHTSDGSITFHAAAGTVMADDWSITTGDGGIALYLPSDFAAQLDVHTGDGTIRNELTLTTGSDGEVTKRILRGKLGNGGRLLKIRTGDGGIRLRLN